MVIFEGLHIHKPQHRLDGSSYRLTVVYYTRYGPFSESYSIEGLVVAVDHSLSDYKWALGVLEQRAPLQIDWYARRYLQGQVVEIPVCPQALMVSRP